MELNKAKQNVIIAYEKGYRVVNGEVVSPFSGRTLKLGLQQIW